MRFRPLFVARDKIDEPVAFGVVSFVARPKSRDKSGKWIDWVKNDLTGPEALDVWLIIARRDLVGETQTALRLGRRRLQHREIVRLPGRCGAQQEPREVYATMIRFGNHEKP